MGKVIPIEMGILQPHVMRITIRAYDEVLDVVSTVGPVTEAIRNDVALILVESALNGLHDPQGLRAVALRRAVEVKRALRQQR